MTLNAIHFSENIRKCDKVCSANDEEKERKKSALTRIRKKRAITWFYIHIQLNYVVRFCIVAKCFIRINTMAKKHLHAANNNGGRAQCIGKKVNGNGNESEKSCKRNANAKPKWTFKGTGVLHLISDTQYGYRLFFLRSFSEQYF